MSSKEKGDTSLSKQKQNQDNVVSTFFPKKEDHISNLTKDFIGEILEFLNSLDIVRLSVVNKILRNIILEIPADLSLRYWTKDSLERFMKVSPKAVLYSITYIAQHLKLKNVRN